MKARLVLNRLSSRARVLEPIRPSSSSTRSIRFPVHRLADIDCDPDELRALADVEGVARIRIDPLDRQATSSQPRRTGNIGGLEIQPDGQCVRAVPTLRYPAG